MLKVIILFDYVYVLDISTIGATIGNFVCSVFVKLKSKVVIAALHWVRIPPPDWSAAQDPGLWLVPGVPPWGSDITRIDVTSGLGKQLGPCQYNSRPSPVSTLSSVSSSTLETLDRTGQERLNKVYHCVQCVMFAIKHALLSIGEKVKSTNSIVSKLMHCTVSRIND